MTFANARDEAAPPPIFAARLTPHRSLGPRGTRIVIAILAVLSLAVGTTFFLLGAWPVPGFLGLDVVAVYVAFRLSFRSGRTAEEISITPGRLTVRCIAADGRSQVTEVNPYWARLEVERRPPFGISRLAIASHGQSLTIGTFLGPAEREQLAAALAAALARAKAVGPA